MSDKRVGIYVDAQHLYHAAKKAGTNFGVQSAKPDYDAIVTRALREAGEHFKTDWRHVSVVTQNIYFTSKNRTLAFQKTLERFGYDVKSYILKGENDSFDWDIELACDVLEDVLRRDVSPDLVISVSGDGDFAALTSRLATFDVESVVLGFPGSMSSRFEVKTRWLTMEELYAD